MNGCHEAGKLQDMLDGFIKKFVLCEKCENPETVLKVSLNSGRECLLHRSPKFYNNVFLFVSFNFWDFY